MRVVKGVGPRDRPLIALVGEAPGEQEERQGRPFVGSAGRLLDSMLLSVGISRDDCYIDNVVQVRPPGNNFGVFYNDRQRKTPTQQLIISTQQLLSRLRAIKPRVTVALGAEALRALRGRRLSIDAWRGSLTHLNGVGWTMGTYHPAYILRMYGSRGIGELDLRKGLRVASQGECFKVPTVKCNTAPTYEQALSWLSDCRHNGDKVAFDIETVGTHVRCIGFSSKAREAFCIPFTTKSARKDSSNGSFIPFTPTTQHFNYWTEDEEREILRRISELFQSPNIQFIAQNFPFDATILGYRMGFRPARLWMDTMLVHHACYCEMPKSLDFLTSIYTDFPRYSDYDAASDASTWVYNCHDAAITREVAFKLYAEARELGVWEFYKHHIEPSMIGLTRMQNRGVKIDIKLRAHKAAECMVAMHQSMDMVAAKTGKKLNPASPKQLKEFLYENLRIPTKYHKGTGKCTTNEKALKQIISKYPQHREFVSAILVYRQNQKLLSTFLVSKLSSKAIIKTSYQTAGTTSGRISSSKTIFGEGGNLQQIPKSDVRRIFVPRDERRVFVRTDLSQAEFRVVVWLARINRVIRLYAEDPKFDVHTWNAARNIYHVDEHEVTKAMRDAAKAVVHGGNYGLGPRTATDISHSWGVEITLQEMKRALLAYRSSMPEIGEWWASTQQQLLTKRTLTSPLGRMRRFYGRMDEATFRSAYSFIPQAVVGDIINRAIGLAEYILPKGNYPVMQVHDEIVWEVERSRLDEMCTIIKNLMEYPIKFDGVDELLVIPTEIAVGDNWWDTKEYKIT